MSNREREQNKDQHTFDGNETGISVLFLWHGDVDVEFIANFGNYFTLLADDLRVVFFRNFDLN